MNLPEVISLGAIVACGWITVTLLRLAASDAAPRQVAWDDDAWDDGYEPDEAWVLVEHDDGEQAYLAWHDWRVRSEDLVSAGFRVVAQGMSVHSDHDVVPVEAGGEVVAHLCVTCDEQLPEEWRP